MLLTLIVAIRSDSLQNQGKWYEPCGTPDTKLIEPRLVRVYKANRKIM